MNLPADDTIAAIATAPGRGGIGVLRLSGTRAADIVRAICGSLPAARTAGLRSFRSSDQSGEPVVIDEGIALYFPAPHSYTGEDVVELQGHGGPVVMDLLLQRTIALGARMAAPGEFTRRAFLNGKLDLAQAEAVADLIDSTTAAAARGALRSLQGAFSARIRELLERLIELRVFVEASIDFPEEDLEFLESARISQRIDAVARAIDDTIATTRQGVLLRDGITLVIAGKPNAGKSSLLNALSGRDSAIVTPVPGTTRDLVRERIAIDGLAITIIDTAGLRESSEAIEQEGIRRARIEIERADRILLVVDSTEDRQPAALLAELFPSGSELPPVTVVMNKCDLSGLPPGECADATGGAIAVSALDGAGIDALRTRIKHDAGFHAAGESDFTARARHLEALQRARRSLQDGLMQLAGSGAIELLAEHLRDAQRALGEITGDFSADDLLGQIFSNFCIGK